MPKPNIPLAMQFKVNKVKDTLDTKDLVELNRIILTAKFSDKEDLTDSCREFRTMFNLITKVNAYY